MVTLGAPGDHISFQSEEVGQYGLLLTLKYLLEDHALAMGSIVVACNGQSVLDRLQSSKAIDPFVAHYDLLWASQNLLEHIPCTIQFTHMTRVGQLGLLQEAWLNIKAEQIAKDRSTHQHQEKLLMVFLTNHDPL